MKRLAVAAALAASLALAGCLSTSEPEEEGEEPGTEESVAVDGVPVAVRENAAAAVPGMRVAGAAKETEEGQVYYELSGTIEGDAVDVVCTPEGEVVAVERTIPWSSVPEAVRAAAMKRLPGLEVKRAERLLKKGVTSYELKGKAGGKFYEIVLSESGEVIEVEG